MIADITAGIGIGGEGLAQWIGPATEVLGSAAIVISIVAGSLSICLRYLKIRDRKSREQD